MAAVPAGTVTFLFTDLEEAVHLRRRLTGRYVGMHEDSVAAIFDFYGYGAKITIDLPPCK